MQAKILFDPHDVKISAPPANNSWELTKELIQEALDLSGGNNKMAAELLGISRRMLVHYRQNLGMPSRKLLRLKITKDELEMLLATHGDLGKVAEVLGCCRSTVGVWVKRFKIDFTWYKKGR